MIVLLICRKLGLSLDNDENKIKNLLQGPVIQGQRKVLLSLSGSQTCVLLL